MKKEHPLTVRITEENDAKKIEQEKRDLDKKIRRKTYYSENYGIFIAFEILSYLVMILAISYGSFFTYNLFGAAAALALAPFLIALEIFKRSYSFRFFRDGFFYGRFHPVKIAVVLLFIGGETVYHVTTAKIYLNVTDAARYKQTAESLQDTAKNPGLLVTSFAEADARRGKDGRLKEYKDNRRLSAMTEAIKTEAETKQAVNRDFLLLIEKSLSLADAGSELGHNLVWYISAILSGLIMALMAWKAHYLKRSKIDHLEHTDQQNAASGGGGGGGGAGGGDTLNDGEVVVFNGRRYIGYLMEDGSIQEKTKSGLNLLIKEYEKRAAKDPDNDTPKEALKRLWEYAEKLNGA